MASITNEVLGARLDNAIDGIRELKVRIDTMSGRFVDQRVYELKHAELQRDIAAIGVKIVALENRKTLINWLTPTLSAILGSVMTYLIINYISRGGN